MKSLISSSFKKIREYIFEICKFLFCVDKTNINKNEGALRVCYFYNLKAQYILHVRWV